MATAREQTKVATCKVCGGVGNDHDLKKHRQVLHPEDTPKQPTQPPQISRDPLLRALLVRKGIVTPAEMVEIEKEFQESGGVVVAVPPPR
jgi:hypothetical protein